MRFAAWGLLFTLLAMAAARAPVRAQSSNYIELHALYSRSLSLSRSGKYAEAIPWAEQYVEGTKARQGDHGLTYAAALEHLGQLLYLTGRLAEAEPLFRRALDIKGAAFGPDHFILARGLSSLAMLLKETNRAAEAEPMMRRALALDEQRFKPDHPIIGADLHNLAQLLQATDRIAEAEPLMRRALAIGDKKYGSNDPDVIFSMLHRPFPPYCEFFRDKVSRAQAALERDLTSGEIEKIEIFFLPYDLRAIGPISEDQIESRMNNLSNIRNINISREIAEYTARTIKNVEFEPAGPYMSPDLRWAAIFYDKSGRRLHSLHLDGVGWSKGRMGYIDNNCVGLNHGLLSWFQRIYSEK